MPNSPSAVHAHEDDLELYARGRLEPGRTLTVESHLTECHNCRERLTQCIGVQLNVHATGKAKSSEKYVRSEPRFRAGDEAIFQELSPLCLDRQKVTIVDISKQGLGILAPKSALPGTIARLRIGNTVELGEVRHCSPWGADGYRIGLRRQTLF
jgi:hypothetical protein